MRDYLTTAMEAAGATSVAVGLGMIYAPLGVIAGGVFLTVAGWLVAR
jgi:hypothetical protein